MILLKAPKLFYLDQELFKYFKAVLMTADLRN